jgi:hypothetical protein
LREIIALKAALEPMLISERRTVHVQVKTIALAGTSTLGSTRDNQLLKGRPLSRAKAQVWREVVKFNEMVDPKTTAKGSIVRPITPPGETAWPKSQRKGYPLGSFRASSIDVIPKRYTRRTPNPRIPLSI